MMKIIRYVGVLAPRRISDKKHFARRRLAYSAHVMGNCAFNIVYWNAFTLPESSTCIEHIFNKIKQTSDTWRLLKGYAT